MTVALLLLLVLFLSLLSQNPISAKCLDSQRSSLLSLFSSSQNLSRNSTTDCCFWSGVSCDTSTGQVVSLDLTNRSISGTLNSTALVSLQSLQILNLSLNFFRTRIPEGLSRLSNLNHLNLSNSGFSGPVPAELWRLKFLQTLDLSINSLSGSTSLSLPSPDFGFLVGNLSGLMELYLSGVVISSPVPKSLVGLVNLSSLHLESCNLTGEFPGEIFRIQMLQSLDVSNNLLLTGILPEFLESSSLRVLTLSGTSFSGSLPESIGNLKLLDKLRLEGCKFSGLIPLSVVSISGLVHLDLSSNNFDGEIPPLGKLGQLVYLELSSNNLSGQIPSLSSLKNAVAISLSSNNLSGVIDLSISDGLLNLSKLDLHNNSLNRTIPSSLFSLPSLKSLVLRHNQFNSQLDEFQNPSSLLSTVDLSNNMLHGPIPSSLFKLAGLNVLVLSSNNFSGVIDLTMIQNLKNLSELDLCKDPYPDQLLINLIGL